MSLVAITVDVFPTIYVSYFIKIMCCPFFKDVQASVKFDNKFLLNQSINQSTIKID